jgi:hypothetical protein
VFQINLDLGSLSDLSESVRAKVQRELSRAAGDLAAQTYAHIVEQVNEKLHSTREQYLEGLSIDKLAEGSWVVALDPKATWIEDGMERHEMIQQILSGGQPARVAKDGTTRYKIIPFKINKAPTRLTAAGRDLKNAAQSAMREQGMPWGKIEKDGEGNPIHGKLHKLDVMNKPIKTFHGAGQGHGPIGDVRQGLTGTPFLKGVNVFQNLVRGKTGRLYTQKDVLTFRVISSKHMGTGRWIHPGVPARHFFDEAYRWSSNIWDTKIKNQILSRARGNNL